MHSELPAALDRVRLKCERCKGKVHLKILFTLLTEQFHILRNKFFWSHMKIDISLI